MEKAIEVLGHLLDRMTTTNAVLLLILMASYAGFYFVIKVLWHALDESQKARIEENKNMIKNQEALATALSALKQAIEFGFAARSSLRDR